MQPPDANKPEAIDGSQSRWAWLGHLAVWPALYAVGVLWLLLWCLDRSSGLGLPESAHWNWQPILFVLLCTHAGYLLDRAKITADRLDPADRAADDHRFRVFARYGLAIRVVVWLELLSASFVALTLHPALAIVPAGVAIGVIAYAGRPATPDRPRPKDLRLLKSFFIATAHVALAAAIAWAMLGRAHELSISTFVAIGAVWLIVFADAIVCDLDDVEADRAFGTRSIPAVLGTHAAWTMIWAVTIAAAALIVVLVGATDSAIPGGLLFVSLAVAALLPKRKDFIDARLPAIMLVFLLVS